MVMMEQHRTCLIYQVTTLALMRRSFLLYLDLHYKRLQFAIAYPVLLTIRRLEQGNTLDIGSPIISRGEADKDRLSRH